jgi:chitinase
MRNYITQIPTGTGKRAIYFHTGWSTYDRNFQVKDIPDGVVDIYYAFFNVDSQGNVVSGDPWADYDKRFTGQDSVSPPDTWDDSSSSFYGNFGQFKKLRDQGRAFNLHLGIGGWTWSKYFSDAVLTEERRLNFANSLISLFKRYPIFNGVSLDWEYLSSDGMNYGNEGNIVRKEDPAHFVLFLQTLRSEFQKHDMAHYIISFCAPGSPSKVQFPVSEVVAHVDQLLVMTYDFFDGRWGNTSLHHTNPRRSRYSDMSCEASALYYMERGVPPQKIFIGGAFYSRGFANTNGLGQPSNGGSTDRTWEDGVVDYNQLPLPNSTEYFDNEAKATFSYDPMKRIFNSYDNRESLIEKARIIFELNLGGIIIWENSADIRDMNSPRCLTRVLRDNVTHGKPLAQ